MLACRATYSTGGGNGSSLSFNFRGANEGYVCARCGWHALGAVHGEGLTNRVPRYETILTDADAYLMHVETGITAAERAEMKAAKRKVVKAKGEARRARAKHHFANAALEFERAEAKLEAIQKAAEEYVGPRRSARRGPEPAPVEDESDEDESDGDEPDEDELLWLLKRVLSRDLLRDDTLTYCLMITQCRHMLIADGDSFKGIGKPWTPREAKILLRFFAGNPQVFTRTTCDVLCGVGQLGLGRLNREPYDASRRHALVAFPPYSVLSSRASKEKTMTVPFVNILATIFFCEPGTGSSSHGQAEVTFLFLDADPTEQSADGDETRLVALTVRILHGDYGTLEKLYNVPGLQLTVLSTESVCDRARVAACAYDVLERRLRDAEEPPADDDDDGDDDEEAADAPRRATVVDGLGAVWVEGDAVVDLRDGTRGLRSLATTLNESVARDACQALRSFHDESKQAFGSREDRAARARASHLTKSLDFARLPGAGDQERLVARFPASALPEDTDTQFFQCHFCAVDLEARTCTVVDADPQEKAVPFKVAIDQITVSPYSELGSGVEVVPGETVLARYNVRGRRSTAFYRALVVSATAKKVEVIFDDDEDDHPDGRTVEVLDVVRVPPGDAVGEDDEGAVALEAMNDLLDAGAADSDAVDDDDAAAPRDAPAVVSQTSSGRATGKRGRVASADELQPKPSRRKQRQATPRAAPAPPESVAVVTERQPAPPRAPKPSSRRRGREQPAAPPPPKKTRPSPGVSRPSQGDTEPRRSRRGA